MNVKTMEGLAGADISARLISTPMNVAKEAENKGDTEKLKRALGYAAGMKDQAEDYGEKTAQGMKQEAVETKKQEELRQEELIKARKEEREEREKRLESGDGNQQNSSFDSVEISEEGKYQAELAAQASTASGDIPQASSYDKSGEAAEPAAEPGKNVDVTV